MECTQAASGDVAEPRRLLHVDSVARDYARLDFFAGDDSRRCLARERPVGFARPFGAAKVIHEGNDQVSKPARFVAATVDAADRQRIVRDRTANRQRTGRDVGADWQSALRICANLRENNTLALPRHYRRSGLIDAIATKQDVSSHFAEREPLMGYQMHAEKIAPPSCR